jgi:hypothetical protein
VKWEGGGAAGAVCVALLAGLFAATAVLTRAAATGRPGSGSRDPAQRYEIDATILESREHGPQLCAGGIAESLPPQCGEFPVEPFSWDEVDDERSLDGTTWAELHLVGTFDGHAFHPTAAPMPPSPRPAPEAPASSPCRPPEGGWSVVDTSKITTDDSVAAAVYANAQPDVAGVWFSWPKGPPDGKTPYRDSVVNLAFTGDLDRHEREARARWGGPLCVTYLSRTKAELSRVEETLFQADAQAGGAGVYLLGGGPDEPANVVRVEVLIADQAAQRWVDDRYGPGVVVLDGRLRPVD